MLIKAGQVLALATLVVLLVAVYLIGQRYKVSSTDETLFIVDTFTGDITAHRVGYLNQSLGELKIHQIAVN